MLEAIGWIALFVVIFGGGFAVGYSERQKEEIREKARRFDRIREAEAFKEIRDNLNRMRG